MLTATELLARAAHQDGVRTLSAYIPVDPRSANPRAVVRAELRTALAAIRARMTEASHHEREAFEVCSARLTLCAEQDVHRQGGGTWVGFAGADDTLYDEMIHPLLPLSVTWEERMRVAPYLSVCNDRAAIVAIVDRQHARLYRYAHGVLSEIERIDTRPSFDEGAHMSAPPRVGFHPGTRGEPAEEAAARKAANAFRQHVAHVASRIGVLCNDCVWIVIGGPAHATRELAERMMGTRESRVGVIDHILATATDAEILAATHAAVRDLKLTAQRQLVTDLITRRDGLERDLLGPDAARASAERKAIATLVVASTWLHTHGADAETLVRAAVAQGATVEIVSGDAAEQLERSASGVATRLRYRIQATVRGHVHEAMPV